MTVVIPTRERADVLAKTLMTVAVQDYGDLEILVSDNFSVDATHDVVQSFREPRLRYVNPGRRLSMAANWEFALSHVRDGWVTIIGDDDGLLPGALSKAARLIAELDVEALRCRVCEYFWPSLTGAGFGRMHVPLGAGCEIRDSRVWIERVLSGDALYTQLPVLYNGGFVATSVLARLRAATGAVYQSCAPDVYSAAAIASLVPRYAYLHEPLAINGASHHSTGTSSFVTSGMRAPAERFQMEPNLPYHADIPMCADGRYPCSLLVSFYESFLQSAALREPVCVERHAHLLRAVLAQTPSADRALLDWARLFAEQHQLNFETLSSDAHRSRVLTAIRRAPAVLNAKLSELRVGSPTLPILDVSDAAVAAKSIVDGGPQRATATVQLLARAVSRSCRSWRTKIT